MRQEASIEIWCTWVAMGSNIFLVVTTQRIHEISVCMFILLFSVSALCSRIWLLIIVIIPSDTFLKHM